jgi:ATP-dependent HslUV protease subunit HslV
MSTIAVVRKGEFACIASDGLIKAGSLKISNHYVKGYGKIQKIGTNYIGVLGPAKAYQVIRSYFREKQNVAPKSADEIFEIVREMQGGLKDAYFLNPSEEGNEEYGSLQMEMLIANPFGIFGVDRWGSVSEYTKYWAKGNGDAYAMGSMFANYDRVTNPKEIAIEALKAASAFDDSTAEPFSSSVIKLY